MRLQFQSSSSQSSTLCKALHLCSLSALEFSFAEAPLFHKSKPNVTKFGYLVIAKRTFPTTQNTQIISTLKILIQGKNFIVHNLVSLSQIILMSLFSGGHNTFSLGCYSIHHTPATVLSVAQDIHLTNSEENSLVERSSLKNGILSFTPCITALPCHLPTRDLASK